MIFSRHLRDDGGVSQGQGEQEDREEGDELAQYLLNWLGSTDFSDGRESFVLPWRYSPANACRTHQDPCRLVFFFFFPAFSRLI